jgi:hypothetical protein
VAIRKVGFLRSFAADLLFVRGHHLGSMHRRVLQAALLTGMLTSCEADAGRSRVQSRDTASYGRPTVFARGEGEERLMRVSSASSARAAASGSGRGSGRTRSAKSAKIRASRASVLASWPVALAKSRTPEASPGGDWRRPRGGRRWRGRRRAPLHSRRSPHRQSA